MYAPLLDHTTLNRTASNRTTDAKQVPMFEHDANRDKKLINRCLSGYGDAWDQLNRLWHEVANGRPISDVLKEYDVDRQVVIKAILEQERNLLMRLVRLGLLDETQADKWLAAIEEIANTFLDEPVVDGTPPTDDNTPSNADAMTVVSQAAATSVNLRKDMAAKSFNTTSTVQNGFGVFLPLSMR